MMVVARTCSSDSKSTQALNGRTPLMLAATFGHSAIVTHLLEHRADVNLVCTIRRHQGQSARFTMQACLVREGGLLLLALLRITFIRQKPAQHADRILLCSGTSRTETRTTHSSWRRSLDMRVSSHACSPIVLLSFVCKFSHCTLTARIT